MEQKLATAADAFLLVGLKSSEADAFLLAKHRCRPQLSEYQRMVLCRALLPDLLKHAKTTAGRRPTGNQR